MRRDQLLREALQNDHGLGAGGGELRAGGSDVGGGKTDDALLAVVDAGGDELGAGGENEAGEQQVGAGDGGEPEGGGENGGGRLREDLDEGVRLLHRDAVERHLPQAVDGADHDAAEGVGGGLVPVRVEPEAHALGLGGEGSDGADGLGDRRHRVSDDASGVGGVGVVGGVGRRRDMSLDQNGLPRGEVEQLAVSGERVLLPPAGELELVGGDDAGAVGGVARAEAERGPRGERGLEREVGEAHAELVMDDVGVGTVDAVDDDGVPAESEEGAHEEDGDLAGERDGRVGVVEDEELASHGRGALAEQVGEVRAPLGEPAGNRRVGRDGNRKRAHLYFSPINCRRAYTMSELVLYVVRDDSVRSSLAALAAAEDAAPALGRGGTRLTVVAVRPREMAQAAVLAELETFGITTLPALVRAGDEPELLAERSDAVAAALAAEVRRLQASQTDRRRQTARQSRAGLGDPQEYREFVRKNIGSKDDGDGNETGEGDFKTQQASAMRQYMERRKALGMETPKKRAARAAVRESPDPDPKPKKRRRESRSARAPRQTATPRDQSMNSALAKAEKSGNVPADDAMMMGVWLANQETT